MSYPPHLMDALGRVYAKAALDRLIKDEMRRQAELKNAAQAAAVPAPGREKEGNVDGPISGVSSDNCGQPLPETRP